MRVRVNSQGLAAAEFKDSAMIKDHDLIGAMNGRQLVGDNDGCAIAQQPVDGPFDQLLGGRIEPR